MKTRKPTAAETKTADEFRKKIWKGRDTINGMIAGISLLGQAEQFRRLQVDAGTLQGGFSPPFLTEGDMPIAQAVLDSWNKLENGLSMLEIQQFGAQFVPGPGGRMDLNIIGPPVSIETGEELPDVQGLSGWFVVALVVAGAAYITHAITDAVKTETEAKKLAYQYSDRLNAVDQKMASAPPEVREAYKQMKQATNYKEQKSLLDRILGGGKGIALGAGGIVLVGAALFAMSRRGR